MKFVDEWEDNDKIVLAFNTRNGVNVFELEQHKLKAENKTLEWQKEIMAVTPGGSEYTSPQFTAGYLKEQRQSGIKAKRNAALLKTTLDWYAEKVTAIAKYSLEKKFTAMEAVIVETVNDAGSRYMKVLEEIQKPLV